MRYKVLRSHSSPGDLVWLANCQVKGRYLTFGLGYFHRRISDSVLTLKDENQQAIAVIISEEYLFKEDKTVVLNGALELYNDEQ